MAEFPALPLFTDAYFGDTRHLTTLQHGAYLLLLMTAWRTTDCALPVDHRLLARWAGMDKRTWENNRDAVLSFWKLVEIDGVQKYQQGRLVDERIYVEQKRSKNSASGKASALKRLNRGSTNVQPKSNETSTPTPTPINIKKELTNVSSKEKINLENLSIDHVADWLNQKRATGRYLTTDEDALLEKFKDYCRSKNKRYADYVAAFRNAFNWDNTPQKGKINGTHSQQVTKSERADAAIQRGLAKIRAAEAAAGQAAPVASLAGPELRCIPRLR